jgi:hypothetical protein
MITKAGIKASVVPNKALIQVELEVEDTKLCSDCTKYVKATTPY